jgi:hypothetical protein
MISEPTDAAHPVAQNEAGPLLPSARYFQVHFECLETLLNEARLSLEALRRDVALLQQAQETQPRPAKAGKSRAQPASRRLVANAAPAMRMAQE